MATYLERKGNCPHFFKEKVARINGKYREISYECVLCKAKRKKFVLLEKLEEYKR